MTDFVSVIIATYNSSAFLIETLESVSKQTWKEIELIITDDCSTDDTVEVCTNWLRDTEDRFTRVEILKSKINTGVPSNANRGLKSANGSWIKFLGADDTLIETCIEDNMSWIASHQGVKALFSQVNVFNNDFKSENLVETSEDDTSDPRSIMTSGRNAESQYKMLLLSDRIHYTPSVFLHRETLLSVGGFDERFKLLEDYPLWLNLTRNGHQLEFMNKVTVNYRRHNKAINNTGKPSLINPTYFKLENFRKVYTYPFLPVDIRLNQRYLWFASQVFRFDWFNRQNKLNKLLLIILTVYLNPMRYYIWVKKRLNKDIEGNEFYL